ncbi:molybdate ABC transporter substrate-binding protein [Pelagibius sp. 7325]|uniref:molybdate ABC transporter substrate-binding protein n=1 Tax=Pelagibius sp. 7325 TaxID=3131994 RepID=UPI0030EC9DFA
MRKLLFAAAVATALGSWAALSMTAARAADQSLQLFAAGSLKAALSDVAADYEKTTGTKVAATFGPSGLLRERIEKGEAAQVFASANMKHPETLMEAGRGGPVALFARNKLCALAQPAVAVTTETLLDVLLDPALRLGTSTPRADPSGDYAWALFAKAEAVKPGAQAALEGKALQLTGGPDSQKAPDGRNPYGWVMESGQADLFLTYCTNAVLARKEVPGLKIVAVPPALAVGADYGLIVLDGAPAEAWRLALHILSPAGQKILADYGFESGALPDD